ncbi:monovalent cation:H+ antiporter, CPA1 (nhx1) [Dinochytrium kinnereticum]|nr:monovalent cation:H+ antiporter, CPA1 (nhx1) [Dinochytrium kinnereticum]
MMMLTLFLDSSTGHNDTKLPIPEKPEENPGESEVMLSWAILILISLLFIILLTSYYLQLRKIRFIHETVVSIFLGIVVGLAIRLSDSKSLQNMVTFDHKYFFNLLLPPIILNCGYDMKRKNFFRNFGTILTFAFAGTMISTLIIGTLIYLIVLTGIHGLDLTFLDCIVFGSILSSTDPVTVLAIFHQMRVDPKLYAIIFGESILNDSVAIVLFATLDSSYLLSNAIKLSGIVSLLFCGIILKHYAYDSMSVRSRRTTKYMFRVLSQMSENFIFIYLGVTLFTKTDAVYLPSFIFLTLVIILFARYASTAPLATLINAISRRFNPYRDHDLIPQNHVLMLWWAGLRGAIAFALSFDMTGPSGPALRTTTLVVCVLTVITLGGTTNYALEKLKIRVGVGAGRKHGGGGGGGYDDDDEYADDVEGENDEDDEETDSSEDDVEDWDDDLPGSNPEMSLERRRKSSDLDAARRASLDTPTSSTRILINDALDTSPRSSMGSTRPPRRRQETQAQADMTHWFMSFDNAWLKPLFTRSRYGHAGGSGAAWGYRRRSGSASPTRQRLLREGSAQTIPDASNAATPGGGRVRRKGLEGGKAASPGVRSSRGFGKGVAGGSASAIIGAGQTSSSLSSSAGRMGSLSAPVTRSGRVGGGGGGGGEGAGGEEERFVGADGKTWGRPLLHGAGGSGGGGGAGGGATASRTRVVSSGGAELKQS